MNLTKYTGYFLTVAIGATVAAMAVPAIAASSDQAPAAAQGIAPRDGQHDFDWEIGTWKTEVKRLKNPLSGAKPQWVEYTGTTVVRKIWDGRANLVELNVNSKEGPMQALSLRLYNPKSRLWNINFANQKVGEISMPAPTGMFANGRAVFYSQETLGDRPILVRFIIFDIKPNSARFEQAYSPDDGKTWELNWIATDTRMKG